MSTNWWDDPTPAAEPTNGAGHTSAQVDSITAKAIASEPETKPAKPTPAGKLAAFLLPAEAPIWTTDAGTGRGLLCVCRDDAHAEVVGDAAAVAGIRVELWTAEAVARVLRGGNGAAVAHIARAFPGSTVRKAGPIPEDAIPFGRWEQEAAE